ncbi:hypothetical protein GMORB2_3581 [Geosmithia morbida]|uniref:Uncharacterized protein n=1 Tax=Geosmithia morbida TaxID=1094350 RepID=A0A9P4YQK2_9HYPO|nr:uncharacterized protein GMORB2_3581 [Geosmithia morbida]KAF4119893.1 hypothetical protein GMORB2_3581 [Geosmithia morbida]
MAPRSVSQTSPGSQRHLTAILPLYPSYPARATSLGLASASDHKFTKATVGWIALWDERMRTGAHMDIGSATDNNGRGRRVALHLTVHDTREDGSDVVAPGSTLRVDTAGDFERVGTLWQGCLHTAPIRPVVGLICSLLRIRTAKTW